MLTANILRSHPPPLMKDDKLWRLHPSTMILLYGRGQEPNETFRIRWKLTSRFHMASMHTLSIVSNPWELTNNSPYGKM